MKIEQQVKLHNRFTIEVRDAKTGELKQKAFAENIILNQAWEYIIPDNGPASSWATHIHFGTGTGTIEATRTALFTPLGYRAASSSLFNFSPSEAWYSHQQRIVLLENEYNGSVLTEVGVGSTALCTHALLKDMNGNQVSLTKVDTDIITIYATIYVKIAAFDKLASVDWYRFVESNAFIRILLGKALRSNYDYWSFYKLPSIFRLYSSASNTHLGDLDVTQTRDIANRKFIMYARVPAASANVGGLDTVQLFCWDYYSASSRGSNVACGHMHFSEATHTQALITEQIGIGDGTQTLFKTAFPFVRAGAVIKVDGVLASPTVIMGVPCVKNIKNYLYRLGATGYGDDTVYNYPVLSSASPLILENRFYSSYGIDTIVCNGATLYVSDDMATWTQAFSGTGIYTVVAEFKQKRYWKVERSSTSNWGITEVNVNAFDNLKNVVFAAPPATGAVITAEYNTEVAAKDIDHVLDITVVLQLGEYTP